MRFKALVHVRLRGSVSDAAGNAVMNNTKRVAPQLEPHLLRIGKVIDFWFDAETEEIAKEEMDLLSDRMLANTVIEDWEYEFHETKELNDTTITLFWYVLLFSFLISLLTVLLLQG
jgi:phosphoribosylformylglycinamidine synthase PurS subunit